MNQIRLGLENGVDVSHYCTSEFDYRQVEEIRKGLEKGVDVNLYADPKMDPGDMAEIRKKLTRQRSRSMRR